MAKHKTLQLRIKEGGDIDKYFFGDPDKIRQALYSWIAHEEKYEPRREES